MRIAGERMYPTGRVLDMLVERRPHSRSPVRLLSKLLNKQGFVPKLLVTDKLRS